MTKSKRPTTVKEWEKVCENLNKALESMVADEVILKARIEGMEAELDGTYDELDAEIEKLEEQLTMTVGVVKYLEMKLERLNPVRGN
jgi:predicted RNase H-like nuclease (RuvC/YqgF family)